MRTDILIAVQNSQDLDKVEKALLIALAIHCNNKTGQCDPSISTLCRDTGWSNSSILRACRNLEKRGFLVADKAYRNSNKYSFVVEKFDLSSVTETPLIDTSSVSQTLPDDLSSVSVTPQKCQGDTSVVSGGHFSSVRVTPKVRSEVTSEVLNEVKRENGLNFSPGHAHSHKNEKALTTKVDEIMQDHSILVTDKLGRIDCTKLARLINQRDNKKDPVPSGKFIRAVHKCVGHYERNSTREQRA